MDEKNDLDLKTSIDNRSKSNYFQVDLMKAWMILLVILDHSTTHSFLIQFGSPFWERVAIPGFIIIMGFNLGISFQARGIETLKEAYSKEYFISKMKRYIIPYLILYFIQGIIYLGVNYVFHPQLLDNFPYDSSGYLFLGYTPFWGPGMWFIPALFGSILIFPLLYICYKKAPILTFISCFIIEWITHYLAFTIFFGINEFNWYFTKMFFITHIFYMFSGIGLGLWISEDHEIFSKRNLIIWILLPISLLYLACYSLFGLGAVREFLWQFYLGWIGGDYNFLSFPYSAFLFLVILAIFPQNPDSSLCNFIRKIGKSTYHILLVQILYFSIVYHFWFSIHDGFDSHPFDYLWFYPLNVLITFTGGIIWNSLETKFYKEKINKKKIYEIIYKILLILAEIFYVLFLFSRYLFFLAFPIP